MTNKERKRRQIKRQREYQSQLNKLKRVGLYEPKSSELTKSRKTRINKLWDEYRDELTDKDVLFVKYPKIASAKKLTDRAKDLGIKYSKRGVFIQKQGQRRAAFEYNKDMGEYQVKLTGKTKFGKNKGSRITEIVPFAKHSAIEKELARMERETKKFKLSKNEYYRIRVKELGNDGFSDSIFENWTMLKKHINDYKKAKADRIQFYRHITIEKVNVETHKRDIKAKRENAKARKARKVDKTGRSI